MIRPGKIRAAWGRRVICLSVLLGMCAFYVPIPTSRSKPHAEDSTPYPCQDHPCGCSSAEHCWTSCCCFSLAEKLAWAEKHGITPPSYVSVPAKKSCAEKESTQQDVKIASGSCCSGGSCCAAHRVRIEPPRQDESIADSETREPSTHYMLLSLVHRCQGKHYFCGEFPWAIISQANLSTDRADRLQWDRPISWRSPRRAIAPSDPPPKISG